MERTKNIHNVQGDPVLDAHIRVSRLSDDELKLFDNVLDTDDDWFHPAEAKPEISNDNDTENI